MAQGHAAPWVVRLAELGYAAKGVIWVLIGLLAAGVAFGFGGATTGSEGVLRRLLSQPFGQALVALLAAGLAAYAAWRLIEAVVDTERKGNGLKGTLDRAGIAINGLTHALLAVEAVRLATGRRGSPGRGLDPEHWIARLLAMPHGPWPVGAAGVTIMVVAVIQLRQAVAGNVAKELGLEETEPEERRWIVRLGRFGKAVSSVVFGIAGYLLLRAATTYNAEEAGGVGDVLATIRGQPGSTLLLGAAAVGLVAYGAFQLVIARYRRINWPRPS